MISLTVLTVKFCESVGEGQEHHLPLCPVCPSMWRESHCFLWHSWIISIPYSLTDRTIFLMRWEQYFGICTSSLSSDPVVCGSYIFWVCSVLEISRRLNFQSIGSCSGLPISRWEIQCWVSYWEINRHGTPYPHSQNYCSRYEHIPPSLSGMDMLSSRVEGGQQSVFSCFLFQGQLCLERNGWICARLCPFQGSLRLVTELE